MFSAFRMGSAVSGRGLCDIDRVLISFAKSFAKRWEVLARRKYTDHKENRKSDVFSSCRDFPILTCEVGTLNNTLLTRHSPSSLAAELTSNAKIMESLPPVRRYTTSSGHNINQSNKATLSPLTRL